MHQYFSDILQCGYFPSDTVFQCFFGIETPVIRSEVHYYILNSIHIYFFTNIGKSRQFIKKMPKFTLLCISLQNLHKVLFHIDINRSVAGESAAALYVTGEG